MILNSVDLIVNYAPLLRVYVSVSHLSKSTLLVKTASLSVDLFVLIC